MIRNTNAVEKAVEVVLGGTIKLLLREVEQLPAGYCFVTLQCGRFIVTARGDNMAYTLPADMQVQVKVSYVDANGNPATVDGPVAWTTSDPTIADVSSAADTEAVVRPGTKIGQAQITATADADLGTGTRELITIMDVTVVGGEAVTGTIEPVGPPTPIGG